MDKLPQALQDMLNEADRLVPPATIPGVEIVLIVHGTFANPNYYSAKFQVEDHWWKQHGSFAQKLERALERHGSAARCSLPVHFRLAQPISRKFPDLLDWSGWSGGNSEVQRRQGAYELARQIRNLQQDPGILRIHVVAHSHGGNVAMRAFRYLNEPLSKLGSFVCLGTPFLHFADTAAWRRWLARIHWPMLLMIMAVAGVIAWRDLWPWGRDTEWFDRLIALPLVACMILLWRYWRVSEGTSRPTPAIAVRFANDEAIQLLHTCAFMASEPHLFLRNLLGGKASRRESSRRSRGRGFFPAMRMIWSRFNRFYSLVSNTWNGPVCRAVEKVTSFGYKLPLVGAIGSLMLVIAFRPYRPKLQPFLLSRMPRLGSLFFHSIQEETDRQMAEFQQNAPGESRVSELSNPLRMFSPKPWITLIAGLTAILYYVFYPIDLLLGLPVWLGAVLTRLAILTGARAAASSATGMDMMGAAFCPDKTSTVPESVREVTVPEEIERDIAQGLDGQNRIDLASLRTSLDPEKQATMLQSVELAFKDVGLLHSQYYQNDGIVDYVARCIASPRIVPEWKSDRSSLPES